MTGPSDTFTRLLDETRTEGRRQGIREAMTKCAEWFGTPDADDIAHILHGRIEALLDTPAPEPAGTLEPQTVTSTQEARTRLLAGDTICYSQDGDYAWFSTGEYADVSEQVITELRKDGHLTRRDDGYRSVWDEASPALRAIAGKDTP